MKTQASIPSRTVMKAALKRAPKRPLSPRAMAGASVALFAVTFAPLLAPPKPYELQELRALLSGESAAHAYAPAGPIALEEDSVRAFADRRGEQSAAEPRRAATPPETPERIAADAEPRPAEAVRTVTRESDQPARLSEAALDDELEGGERRADRPAQPRAASAPERAPQPIEVEAEPLEELAPPAAAEPADADMED